MASLFPIVGAELRAAAPRPLLLVSILALPVTACLEEDYQGDPDLGEEVYRQIPAEAVEDFTCETCHSLEEPAEDGLRRPGHALGDAYRRPHWKNGTYEALLPAVNTCLDEWMGVADEDLWGPDDLDWLDLEAFLKQQAPNEAAPPLEVSLAEPLVGTDLEGGDPEMGRLIVNETCAICHGFDAKGGLVFGLEDLELMPELISRKVRLSGPGNSNIFDGLNGGRMPFWAADRLSDDELRDIIAFLTQPPPP